MYSIYFFNLKVRIYMKFSTVVWPWFKFDIMLYLIMILNTTYKFFFNDIHIYLHYMKHAIIAYSETIIFLRIFSQNNVQFIIILDAA